MKKILICLIIIFAVFFLFRSLDIRMVAQGLCSHRYDFINPGRRCLADDPPKKQEYDDLQTALTAKIDALKKQGILTDAAVYFRDTENGPVFGINSNAQFAPASLLKTPVMIAAFKEAEDDPNFLNQKAQFKDTIPVPESVYGSGKTLSPNVQYTISELVRRMIVYSDNASLELLKREIQKRTPDFLDQTYIDLGIFLQDDGKGEKVLNVKSYASLFRALYNASYLDREMSDRALQLLSQTTFSHGLVAGVPAGTVVAHKFGYLDTGNGILQLHDCGIVYHPGTPYLLCVMTRGKDVKTIASVIVDISKDVYADVTKHEAENN